MNHQETFKVVKVTKSKSRKYASAIYETGVYYYPKKLTTAPSWALSKGYGITSFNDLKRATYFKTANVKYGPHKIFRCIAIDILENPALVRFFPENLIISKEMFDSYLSSIDAEEWPLGTVISTHLLLLEEVR